MIAKKPKILSVFLWVLLLQGCVNPFAPKLDRLSTRSELIITEQKTPEEVLQNFRYAYIFKDSLLYSDLLDSAFIFVYFDPNQGTSGQFISWGRDVDLRTTGRLFRVFDVIDLIWNATVFEDLGETNAKVSKSFNLALISGQTELRVSGNAVFYFRKSVADGKWRIIKWKDESNL